MNRYSPWLVSAACLMASGVTGHAQPPNTPPVSSGTTAPPVTPGSVTTSKLSAADLEEMLAPIALYPDTLLANTLAACVYEDDCKAAGKFVAGGGKVDANTKNDWDASVKVIAAFPEVIKLLSDNPEWAVAIGQAYLVQGQDVMAAVQTLRARAWANGALKTTPEQTVVTEGKYIIIEPAKPDIIYVPTYNPSVVYVDNSANAAAAGVIGFGLGIATGLIIANNMDCNWHGGCVYWGYGGGWHGGYHGGNYHGGNNNININGDVNIGSGNGNNIGNGNRPGQEGSQWKPNPDKVRPGATSGQSLNNYKGVGSGSTSQANARIPGRTSGSQPIAAGKAPPTPSPRPSNTARPSAPAARPDSPASRPSTPAAKPSTPATRPSTPAAKPSTPAARPSTPASRPSTPAARPAPAPKPSGFNPSGGGSRSSGASRGGGGASRGGGGRGR